MGNAMPRVSLPLESSDFVGRRQELREVKRLLEKGRLVTLIGPGGVGKTRRALLDGTLSVLDKP